MYRLQTGDDFFENGWRDFCGYRCDSSSVLHFAVCILQFKKEWKAYRKFSPKTQKVFVLIEIFDVLSGVPILSTWLMYLSAFCIVMGVIMITTH